MGVPSPWAWLSGRDRETGDDEAGTSGSRRAADGEPVVRLFERASVEVLGSLDDLPARLGRSRLLWIDLAAPSEDGARRVAEALELDDAAARDLTTTSGTPGFRDAGRFVHLTLHAPVGKGTAGPAEVECLVGDHWVVTAHDRPVSVLDEFADLASGSGPTGELDGPSFLAALLEWVLNEYALAFERLEEQLEEFDERAMRGRRRPEDEIEQLVALRRQAGSLRRALAAHRSPLLALTHPELEALGDSASARRFQVLLDRYDATVQTARDTRESIVSSFDVLIARTGHRTNEIMKVLTLASVALLPGALVAGVMGMNFEVGVFEHADVFWLVVGAIVAIGVAPLGVAKLRGWL